ncbi:MAG: hypothetical protein RIS92_1141 [Verrucomicrobiota bacterium]
MDDGGQVQGFLEFDFVARGEGGRHGTKLRLGCWTDDFHQNLGVVDCLCQHDETLCGEVGF